MIVFRIEVLANDNNWYGLFSSRWAGVNYLELEDFRESVRYKHNPSPWIYNDLKYRHYFKKEFMKRIDIPYDTKIRWHRKYIDKKDIVWEDETQVVLDTNEITK